MCLTQNWTLKIGSRYKLTKCFILHSLKEAEENRKRHDETRIRRSAEKVNYPPTQLGSCGYKS